jgi:deoxyadenosine/deoxycytidine kinase
MQTHLEKRVIGVVGPCASGKSTLIANLMPYGIAARHIAQEHSYVADMWQRITHPDTLIFLDVSYELSKKRRRLDWSPKDYAEQQYRLRHARQNADLYIQTDPLQPDEVLDSVLRFLTEMS